jgi:DNA repair protein RadA
LFIALAAHHMRPLRDVMISLKWGEAVPTPAAICAPIVTSLMTATNEMGFTSLHGALALFGKALSAGADGEARLNTRAREALLSAYAKLSSEMPEVFALDGERTRRETVIVHSLLRQIPGVHHLAIHKLYAAGLANLDMMFLADPDAISSTTGIDATLASRIVDRFQTYRRETRDVAPGVGRETERDRLAALIAELRQLHERHEQVASGWSEAAIDTKRKLRQARIEGFMQVKVLLARLGELDRLGELEPLPFQRRIERVEDYLRETGTERSRSSVQGS